IVIAILLAGVIFLGAIETIQRFWELFPSIAAWVAFTPAGFLARPAFVAQGQWGMAVRHLVVMLAYIVVLLGAYTLIVNRSTAAAGAGQSQQRQQGLGLLGRADSPMKAIGPDH